MTFQNRKSLYIVLLTWVAVLIGGCDSSNDGPPPMASFEVTVTNLTNAQPLSPIAVIAHRSGYTVFSVGTAASQELEMLAEGGDNTALLAAADTDTMVIATASGAAPIGPAGSETVAVTLAESELSDLLLSISTMLVNTNDAFTGQSETPIGAMAVGDIMTLHGVAYDAGTEADTELATEIPGPAGGGEGFNAVRDDQTDVVSMHSGIVSQDDGLASSNLTEQHRFDNPVAQIRIERTD